MSVSPATTPEAHRLYLTPRLCGQFKPVTYMSPHPTSGALGEMVPLHAVEQLRDGSCGIGLNDSVILASRLLVGYDDAKEVFIMHDPSLGPNLELGYADFERMWRATEAKYSAVHPAEMPTAPAGWVAEVRARTPDDEAARGANADFDGYALAHTVLARLLACSDKRADRKEAKRELSHAKKLCNTKAQRRVADELGRDFHVIGCKGERLGWYRP